MGVNDWSWRVGLQTLCELQEEEKLLVEEKNMLKKVGFLLKFC